MSFELEHIQLQPVPYSDKVNLYMLRIDQINPEISGNKWFKLKYNIEEALTQNQKTVLTFGGAFSNHLAAVAAAGKKKNLKTIGVIRGEEHLPLNPTLQFAKGQGMIFHYMDRITYREKSTDKIISDLGNQYGEFYLIPEGGTNDLAIKGTEEILDLIDIVYDYVCCPIGTGGTIVGLINSCPETSKVLGFPALKGDFIEGEVRKLIKLQTSNFELLTSYHFGGYAKHKPELIEFINTFKLNFDIPLDPVYTGKMIYGICDLIDKNYFEKGTTIVAIHTGGLQGIKGFNERFKNIIND